MRLPVSRRSLVAVLVFIGAFFPRAASLDEFLTTDEAALWKRRTMNFAAAVEQGDWASTVQAYHPGVMTMWLGTVGLHLNRVANPTVDPADDYLTARPWIVLPLVIVNALVVAASYLMLRRLLNPNIALLAALLWALDPFLIAHGQILHVDGLSTSFMALSFLLGCVGLGMGGRQDFQPRVRYPLLIASAVVGAFAGLTKITTLFVFPLLGLVALVMYWRRDNPVRSLPVKPVVVLAVVGVVTIVAFYPALGSNVSRVLERFEFGVRLATRPHGAGNFFMGQPVDDPGILFYVVTSALRMTPWTFIGVLVALFAALRSGVRRVPPIILWLVVYAVLFTVLMSVQSKKFDRYVLQIFPALVIIGAYGIMQGIDLLATRLKSAQPAMLRRALVGVILVANVLTLVVYHPYAIAYYNPLLGGSQTAINTMLVGWGEGLEHAAAFLNAQDGFCDDAIAPYHWVVVPFADCFHPVRYARARDLLEGDEDIRYLIVYINQVQREHHAALMELLREIEPVYTFRAHGIDYVSVYDVESLELNRES